MSSTAVTVTVCGVFQLVELKVSVEAEVVVCEVLPMARLTSAVGCDVKTTV